MSLFTKLLPRTQQAEQRMLGLPSAFAPGGYDGMYPDTFGEMRAMQSTAVWACVRVLADTIAAMPWYVCKRDKDNISHRVYPTPAVIRQPCADINLTEWKWMVVATLALRGNSFHMITGRDNAGNPTGLMPIHPDYVFLERRVNVLEWYDPIYRVLGTRIPNEDIIHIKRFILPGEPLGLSPISQGARAIGITLAAEEYGHRYFKDSANPSGILKTDQNLDPDEIERNMKEWVSSNGGRRLPAFLSGGLDFKTITITPEESQFLETRRFQVSDIARLYGVPPHLIGDQEKATSWGTGIAQMNLGFMTYTLMGWINCIEAAISQFLPGGRVVQFDTSALLRGDFTSQVAAIAAARNASLLSANEGRQIIDRPPIPNGDGYLQSTNTVPLGFTPDTTPMPKVVEEGTVPGKPASGQQPEAPGIGNSRKLCRLNTDGRTEYYDFPTEDGEPMEES